MTERVNVAFSVDALSPRLTGIGRYCLELSRGLRSVAGIGRVSYFCGNTWLEDPEEMLQENWQSPRRNWRRRLTGWRERLFTRGGIVHSPNYFLPTWADFGVVTVHDLSVLLYPETHPIERVKDFERRFQQTLDRSAAVITDCETIRREVIEQLGVSSDRVFAVPLGIRQRPSNNQDFESVLAAHGLQVDSYTLCVSTFEPRKRIDRLIDAYSLLASDLRSAFPLVLVGASGWLNDALHGRIEAAQAAGWLKRLDFVPDAERDALYRGARLFVYPSLYEGFGLPPLEAMLYGVPTVISDAATLVETTRGAARIVNVEDCTSFAALLAESLQDGTWRSSARIAGQHVAEGYTWYQCITGTVAVYHNISAR